MIKTANRSAGKENKKWDKMLSKFCFMEPGGWAVTMGRLPREMSAHSPRGSLFLKYHSHRNTCEKKRLMCAQCTHVQVMCGQLLEVSAGGIQSLKDNVVCSLTVQSDLVVLPNYHLFVHIYRHWMKWGQKEEYDKSTSNTLTQANYWESSCWRMHKTPPCSTFY